MDHALAVAARWSGRALILFGIFVLVASFFLPAGVQFLNPLVCPDNLELNNARKLPAGLPDDEKLEVVCTSTTYSENALPRILLVTAGSIAVGLGFLYVAQRMDRPRYLAPGTTATR
ncbi:MAG: hypothetical protein KDA97_06725 [Acidimicrobiales bacterium]|nr:hypothetical protein [Acidimicrobiales bacterium]